MTRRPNARPWPRVRVSYRRGRRPAISVGKITRLAVKFIIGSLRTDGTIEYLNQYDPAVME